MGEKEKKTRRPIRPSYLQDFKKGADGQYAYAGKYSVCELQGEAFRRWLFACWLRLGGALCALVACGFLPRTGMDGRAHIIFPYAFSVAFVVLCVVKFVTPSKSGGRLPVYRHERAVQRLLVYAAIPAVLSAVSAAGLLADLATGAFAGLRPSGIATCLLLAAAAALLALFVGKLRGAKWQID